MRIRIGTTQNNYRNYGHGRSNMSEFERLLHLFVSLQILFGSRRGGVWIPVIILALLFGGIFYYNHNFNNPEKLLARADAKWNTGVETDQMEAITDYMEILNRKDANLLDQILNPSQTAKASSDAGPLVKDSARRKILYKRIIIHKYKYVNEDDAAIWIEMALNEKFNLEFVEDDVASFWDKVVAKLEGKPLKSKPDVSQSQKADEDERSKSKFDDLPGVDKN
jgi:hypothetical protein